MVKNVVNNAFGHGLNDTRDMGTKRPLLSEETEPVRTEPETLSLIHI